MFTQEEYCGQSGTQNLWAILVLKAHGPIFQNEIVMHCLKNNRSKDLNFKFQFYQSNCLDVESILYIAVAYILLCLA